MLIDGGLSANVPVGVAREASATRVIISDVGTLVGRTVDAQSTAGMLSYLLDFLFTQTPYTLQPGDIGIRPSVDAFGLLNFAHDAIEPLRMSGYEAARKTFSACAAPRTATPDGIFSRKRAIAASRASRTAVHTSTMRGVGSPIEPIHVWSA